MENIDISNERYTYHNIGERPPKISLVNTAKNVPDIFIINISPGGERVCLNESPCCQVLFSRTFTGASEGRRVEIKLRPKWGQLPAETKDIYVHS